MESQLSAAQKKRESLVEAQQCSEEQRPLITHVLVSSQPAEDSSPEVSAPTDISPALAYQPSRKLPPVGPECSDLCVDAEESLEGKDFEDLEPDMGIPETELLDNTCAKSKAEAVRQSLVSLCDSILLEGAVSEI